MNYLVVFAQYMRGRLTRETLRSDIVSKSLLKSTFVIYHRRRILRYVLEFSVGELILQRG